MNFDVALQLQFGDAAQILAQDFFLDFELMFVVGVLVMASAAVAVMRTVRRDTVRRRLHDCGGMGACEARLFFSERRVNFFGGENEGNEYGFTAAVVLFGGRCVSRRFGGKAS